MFTPKYNLTNQMVSWLSEIAETKAIIDRAKLLPKQELKLKREAMIRMTHASTKIEGNALNIHQVEALYENKGIVANDRDIYEVKNYIKALKYISKVVENKQPIVSKVIFQIHKLVTEKTLPKNESGYYRKGLVYIVRRKINAPRETIYTAPPAKEVPKLMADLIAWIHKTKKEDVHPIIAAGVVHQEIAAIHPFSDGNGRTARAIATLILYQRGYDFRRLFALEDYYNKDREKYYKAINIGENYKNRSTDLTPWLEYFTYGVKEEISNVKTQIISLSKHKAGEKIEEKVYLDKEQIKIIDFLEQNGIINIQNAIIVLECPKRTAQLCLQKLKQMKIIEQIGKGPSTRYRLAD